MTEINARTVNDLFNKSVRCLEANNITLRKYQKDGLRWFLNKEHTEDDIKYGLYTNNSDNDST